jgi:hypothetical protein
MCAVMSRRTGKLPDGHKARKKKPAAKGAKAGTAKAPRKPVPEKAKKNRWEGEWWAGAAFISSTISGLSSLTCGAHFVRAETSLNASTSWTSRGALDSHSTPFGVIR